MAETDIEQVRLEHLLVQLLLGDFGVQFLPLPHPGVMSETSVPKCPYCCLSACPEECVSVTLVFFFSFHRFHLLIHVLNTPVAFV